MPQNVTPTLAIYAALQRAFDHFNASLFDASLPHCLITLRSSARNHGYMHARRFICINGATVDELGINPGYFAIQSVEETMATLVHEMAHHWQNHFGNPSKSISHNREWAEKMEKLGLMPSHTGLPGGKKTGRKMSDYIIPDGQFIRCCASLIQSDFVLPWFDAHVPIPKQQAEHRRHELVDSGVAVTVSDSPAAQAISRGSPLQISEPTPRPEKSDRRRYVCTSCHIRAWSAPDAQLQCGACELPLVEG